MNDLKQILYEVQGKHFVFLDGVTGNDKEEILCNEWLLEDRENRRLVLVSSMASRRKAKMDEDTELNLQEHFVSSWTLDEYFKAVKDNELFHAVEPRLDASNELDPVVVVVSNDDTVSHINGEMVLRQEYVKSKYYFAGGSVRFMFGYTTARVIAELDKAVKALPNATADATGIVGDRSADVINRLCCGFRGTGNRQGIISRGGVTLYDGANEIHWPEDTIHTFNPLDITKLPVAGWLKPLKYNQGGYDAVYIDQDQGLVRFVQVTLAQKHSFRIRYFSDFFAMLRNSSSSFVVKTLEVFFIIERRLLPEFKFSEVTGEGMLAAFAGWEKGKEKVKARLVGIESVDRWKDFNW